MVEAKVRCLSPPKRHPNSTNILYPSISQRPLKAQLSSEVAAAANDDEAFKIRERFAQKEMALEHMIDQRPLDLHMELDVSYKCAAHNLNHSLIDCHTLNTHTNTLQLFAASSPSKLFGLLHRAA